MIRAALLLFAIVAPSGLGAANGWVETGREGGVALYARPRAGTSNHESLGVGAIDAPPWVVKNALDDVNGHMPYLLESRVIKRDAQGMVVYMRTSAPLVADRDYSIRLVDESFVRSDGSVVYVTRWRAANDEGPPPQQGVVRVAVTEGEWRLEPMANGTKTRAIYFVYAEPGGGIPEAIAKWAQRSAMSGIFGALRDRVLDAKYAATAPATPTRREEIMLR
ncbi:MAG TPA: hypothetical protein VGO62_05100 [Myxococcota bacterium]|jgi:hypothetical protein